jgi:hypothetical protein
MPELKIKHDNSGFWLWNVDKWDDDDIAFELITNHQDKVMVIWLLPDSRIMSVKMTGLTPEECAEYTKNGAEGILETMLNHPKIQEAQAKILEIQ